VDLHLNLKKKVKMQYQDPLSHESKIKQLVAIFYGMRLQNVLSFLIKQFQWISILVSHKKIKNKKYLYKITKWQKIEE